MGRSKEQGYHPIVMWECQWNKLKQTNPAIDQFLNGHFPGRKGRRKSADQILEDVRNDEFFGAIEVDIEVPEDKKDYFREMTPIFKNVDISIDDIGDHMQGYAQEHGCMPHSRRAIIGSYWAEKILLATPLLQFYLEQGLVVTHIYRAIQWVPNRCFERFGDFVSEARRAGDKDVNKKILAETAKLVGNAGYGRFIMDVSRHEDVTYSQDEQKVSRVINSFFFKDVQQIDDTIYEVKTSKKKLVMKFPIQIGFFVYQYAKLRMLQFYYQFLDHFVDRSDYELLEMDTESAYMALAGENLESLVKPELQEEFRGVKDSWLPRTGVHAAYDKRTPGLFKIEWTGEGFVGLNSKRYYCSGDTNKVSCKGISKRNNDITKDVYLRVLETGQTEGGVNKGFRMVNHRMLTYSQFRDGFSYFYPKREVLEDGITTIPLDI